MIGEQAGNHQPCAVDIVVPTRNRAALIRVAVESLCQSSYPHFTLWIVDQSDDDATKQALAWHLATEPRLRYLPVTSRGAGLSRFWTVGSSSVAVIHPPELKNVRA